MQPVSSPATEATTQQTLLVIGAGPKAIALAAKRAILANLLAFLLEGDVRLLSPYGRRNIPWEGSQFLLSMFSGTC